MSRPTCMRERSTDEECAWNSSRASSWQSAPGGGSIVRDSITTCSPRQPGAVPSQSGAGLTAGCSGSMLCPRQMPSRAFNPALPYKPTAPRPHNPPTPRAPTPPHLHRHAAQPAAGRRRQVRRLGELQAQRRGLLQRHQPPLAHQRQPLQCSSRGRAASTGRGRDEAPGGSWNSAGGARQAAPAERLAGICLSVTPAMPAESPPG